MARKLSVKKLEDLMTVTVAQPPQPTYIPPGASL